MSIKTKNAGAYADIVGVFHKRAGAYEAVQGVYVKAGGVYGRVDAAPLPDPTTVNFTSAQVSAGFVGSVSTTKNAARVYGRAARTAWVGVITGTEAKLTATSEFGNGAGLIEVSVDGGAFSAATGVSGVWTLFTGLPHAAHAVVWRYGGTFGDAPYIASSGNVLQVTGQPPSMVTVAEWVQPASQGSLSVASAQTIANATNYTPNLVAISGTGGSNVASVRLRGAFSKLFVGKNSKYVYVSKNGAAPTRYGPFTETNTPVNGDVIALDGSLATYNVWAGRLERSGGGTFGVSGNAVLVDIGAKRRLDQFGDSITDASTAGVTSSGECEVFRVAAALGFVGGTTAVGGYTIAQLDTLLTTALPQRAITSNDVAVLAIGRNNVPTIDAAAITSYQSCINKLLTAGYGKVLCRGILPSPTRSTIWTSENAALSAGVAALGNANAIWIDVYSCPAYDAIDSTHPSDAGYVTIAAFVQPLYAAALGI